MTSGGRSIQTVFFCKSLEITVEKYNLIQVYHLTFYLGRSTKVPSVLKYILSNKNKYLLHKLGHFRIVDWYYWIIITHAWV